MHNREVIPLKQTMDLTLSLPGSKSITNRALLCAAFAKGKSRIFGALKSDDAQVMLDSLKELGVEVREIDDGIEITGLGGEFAKGNKTLDLHNAGTATRFLTAAMVIRDGATVITGDPRMQERPIKDLVEGLRQLGAEIDYLKTEGYPPIEIKASHIKEDHYLVKMKGDKSSQYFSALLMLGPVLDKALRIEVMGDLVSKPYIDTTIAVLKAFGIKVVNNAYQSFEIEPQAYQPCDYRVEGDASGASYFSTLQFLHGGKLHFKNLKIDQSIQGDIKFSEALTRLKEESPRVINMESMPDAAMTLAIAAVFAKGETTITGLSTLRIKETDRLLALKTELTKVGVQVETTDDSITIQALDTENAKPASIATYNDHRMAMCFAVLGTKLPGIVIEDIDCVEKTYPMFWEDLDMIYSGDIALGDKHLLLTGMRSTGKTMFGKKLAHRLNRQFVDLDTEIEGEKGITIDEMVKQHGWEYFRSVEQEICSKIYKKYNKPLVLATGGGVVLSESNMKYLKEGAVNVFIHVDAKRIASRLANNPMNRPSLTGQSLQSEVMQVWEERRELYLKYADYVCNETPINSNFV